MTKLKTRIHESREIFRYKQDRAQLREAMEHIHELEAHIKAIKKLRRAGNGRAIKARRGKGVSEATAIATISDVHLGQEIKSEQVNGLNEYNARICRERCDMFFERVVRLTNKERQDVNIDELVLFLGGDFLEGALHMDTIMATDLSGPISQVVEMNKMLEAGIKYLIKEGGYKQITVVCADGNHGRISAKQHHHSRRGNALEYYLYYNLASRFPELNWYIKESLLTYVPVYDSVIRFMHGDRIAYGGVNGFYTYLHRRIYEWDTSMRANYTILGHLHQYTPNRRYMVNGSMVGYNPFAVALGAQYEPPIQGFMLWDKKRGPTVHIPVLFS